MLITLDFETYFDKDYSLTKMSTSEYVRDPRFEVISCSIKKDNNLVWCYWGHKEIAAALKNIDWQNTVLLAHHTQFDGLILSHHFDVHPARMACTLSMARALLPKLEKANLDNVAKVYNKSNKLLMPDMKGKHAKDFKPDEKKAVIAYNNGDVQSCHEIYEEMLKGYPLTELDLIDLTIKMFTEPVLLVDLPKARKELVRERKAKAEAINNSGFSIETLSSNLKFAEALEDLGVTVPMKLSPSVKDKMIPAIAKSDERLQALLGHPEACVRNLVIGRLAAKSTIGESRAERLIDHGSNGKKLPIYYNYCAAHTFRWSGGDKLNPQNFKQKSKVGGALRACIKAPPGHYMVIVDAAQIEARIVAWLAGEKSILDAF